MNTTNIKNYKPKEFAELIGVSVKTLQRWDREGILKPTEHPQIEDTIQEKIIYNSKAYHQKKIKEML